ncbi:MAG: NAD(P)/FAD-dependent oxidoreductase [Pseudodesulfovibrio sp.]|uniref:FAD-dependent pyridine nucleotide-disulfide oxidoreductase n=1 Tax=Pseudodesulfovibrio aespoeensis (strain ATCC 700646 / DSM 10631 / Aspo-2) TaxID=643562 RepID=E6VSS7_PSEA9|nr:MULTISPECIES: NAD(P)/FAD-dependent oxidoreductase [Pseudodesulfovibrio]MBU4192814.1 NAD(P)/FAD-dependent oxidoreductase [Pseudomonadota bacterium]ADU63171.1 FAD-dependent pyridine nucleotide-disulfide oxidoreductase [Pseudodesulfovibrio aespoeensis Aspo-2]MBU4244366.1 NAD(P)/FAD-dependent oxidoreductase [Pseudomonadota bacterium]MBU4378282.1 NAD(P)/FAD-dependent oxidoreductase [Pseudomonadota bacterium]MBU4475968.1 NAD(P)/FAD-dependent oxidoreductase [Pseudomonadota bacterium]
MTYDLIVLGAGPGGFDAATAAAGYGLKVALVEKRSLGGTCLNRGCIPTKLWLGATSAIDELHNQSKLKIASGEVVVDFAALQARVAKHLAGTRKAMAMQLEKLGVDLFEGFGRLAGEGTVEVEAADGIKTLKYANLVIATGSKPIYFPGLEPDGDCVLDSDMFLAMETMPASLIVVGAGFIGLEMAQVAHRFGAQVTVVDAMDRVAPLEDPEVSKALLSIFKRWKWDVQLAKRVAGLRTVDGKGVLTMDSGEKLTADKILVAVGRGPVTEGLGLDTVGIEVAMRRIEVDENLQAAPNIYAVGDVNGLIQLAHAAAHQGHHLAAAVAGKTDGPYESGPVPSVLYGAPEVMRVGRMENEIFLSPERCEVSRAQLAANPMAQAHASTQGFVKVVWADGRVAGVTAVGHDVSRLTTPATMIVAQGWTGHDLHSVMFPHPSLDESLLAALRAERTPVE